MATPGWSNDCANGQVSKMPHGEISPAATIPDSWHGTADTTLLYPNYAEMLKQWSNIHNVEFSKNLTNTLHAVDL
jgi:acetylxylan esterase